jgi:hypothetical protein
MNPMISHISKIVELHKYIHNAPIKYPISLVLLFSVIKFTIGTQFWQDSKVINKMKDGQFIIVSCNN